MASPRASRVSRVLLVVLATAIAVGATASILVAPNTSSPASSGPTPEVFLPAWVFAAAVLGMLLVLIIVWVLYGITAKGRRAFSTNAFLTVLFAIVLIAFVVVALRVLGFDGVPNPPSNNTTGPSPPTTTPPTNPPCQIGCNVSGVGSFIVAPGIPSWVPLAVLALVAVIAVAVAVPQTRRYLADRRLESESRNARTRTEEVQIRAALAQASTELDLGGDPRRVILGLYQQMLFHLRPMAGSVEFATPEEIRILYLEHFGVRPDAARTLTRLFEEARYSDHPMGPTERDRARDAVRATIDDLDRRTVPE